MSKELEQSPLQRGLHLESIERSGAPRGDIYALVDYPFTTARGAFTSPSGWCDALILHLNVKYCHSVTRGERTVLSVAIGRKYDQPLEETFRVEFGYNVMVSGEDYMEVNLDAPNGPLGSRDYHIGLELVRLEGGRAFLHVRYSFTYGFRGSFAMGVYFATTASAARWFSASELYARQLHEVDHDTYLTMKRREHLRQQTLQ